MLALPSTNSGSQWQAHGRAVETIEHTAMGHDGDLPAGMLLGDTGQFADTASLQLDEGFATANAKIRLSAFPTCGAVGITGMNFLPGQALEGAEMPLAGAHRRLHLQWPPQRQSGSGLLGALQIAAVDGVNGFVSQGIGQALGLQPPEGLSGMSI